jgi:hypothetical protein
MKNSVNVSGVGIVRIGKKMNYIYRMMYEAETDEFCAIIDNGSQFGEIIYEIEDTHEMIWYIRSGKMSHIDDVDGLENYLKGKGILQVDDSLLLCEKMS